MSTTLTNQTSATYVTSSRAAQLSGYSQDYVGQLCRSGSVECKRVAGEWQVLLSGLLAYKKRFNPGYAEGTSALSQHTHQDDVGTSDMEKIAEDATDDGYVSSATAAEKTGYSQDYIGQLARGGAVKAKKVGRRWFVDLASVLEHKKHNDSLLAALQTESVGLARPPKHEHKAVDSECVQQDQCINKREHEIQSDAGTNIAIRTLSHVTYHRDDGSLIPAPGRGTVAESDKQGVPTDVSSVKIHTTSQGSQQRCVYLP